MMKTGSALLMIAVWGVTGCTDQPPCLTVVQRGRIEQMVPITSVIRMGSFLGMPGTSGKPVPHTLAKVRLSDGRAAICHIDNDSARVFRTGEVVRGPWGSAD
jgi:hypothetical protein